MNVCMAPCPIVFDLDGTLIDSAPDIHACVNAALREHGYGPLSLHQVRGFIGGGVDLLWQRIGAALRIDPVDKRDVMASFMARYQVATTLTRMFPGVPETLGLLADRGHPLGICTNKPMSATRHVLAHFGIETLFGAVIGGDSLPSRKPDPAPLRACLAGLGAHPERPEAILVGDSEFDAQCAAAAGVPLMLFTGGYRGGRIEDLPHLVAFGDFAALPGLIESRLTA